MEDPTKISFTRTVRVANVQLYSLSRTIISFLISVLFAHKCEVVLLAAWKDTYRCSLPLDMENYRVPLKACWRTCTVAYTCARKQLE